MIKVSDYIADRLSEKYGVDTVFLIPGGGAMHLNDSFGKHPKIKYVVNHHEQASALGAEGYARVSGKLGVVNVTSGPGGLNTLTGVMGQWTDSVPVIYISGQIKQETSIYAYPDLQLRQMGDQEADIISVVKPITKYAVTLRDKRNIKKELDKAISISLSGRPGPVWIDIPLDIQGALIDEAELVEYTEIDESRTLEKEELKKIPELINLLKQAERPVIVAGHGVRIAKAVNELQQLLTELKIPVLTTFNGMDVVEENDPYYIGRIGTLGHRAGNFALQNSDLMISLGTRNNIRQVSYNWNSYARAAKKVVVDIDINEIKKPTLKADLYFCTDAKDFLTELNEQVKDGSFPSYENWLEWCLERKEKYKLTKDKISKDGCVNPYLFIHALSTKMKEDTILIAGNGSACVVAFQTAEVKKGQRYIWNSGCATMGYDLPAAIGAAFAEPDKEIIILCGDGSIMMNLQELATIEYNKLNVKIILLNNNGYISMRQTQSSFFNNRITASDPETGVGFPNFDNLAKAFHFKTFKINNDNEYQVLDEVLNRRGPVFCEVMLDHDYKFEPKLSSVKLEDGTMISKPLEDLSPLLDRIEFIENMIIPPIQE